MNRQQLGAHARTCRALRSVADGNLVAIPDHVPVRNITLHSMCRRPPPPWGRERRVQIAPRVENEEANDSPYVRDYREVSVRLMSYVVALTTNHTH